MEEPQLPSVMEYNENGSCWTCRRRSCPCDLTIPVCHRCLDDNLVCEGYTVRVKWPSLFTRSDTKTRHRQSPLSLSCPKLSPLGLNPAETNLLNHFAKNLARIALAIDYDGNGYRRFIKMATVDSVLLNAILAVTASHYCKWRRIRNTQSLTYMSRAFLQLQNRLQDTNMVGNESTLAAMLFLLSYEVFNGSDRWKHHLVGISGWIRTFGHRKDLDPFLKTWISMVDTQSAMNLGVNSLTQVESWVDASSQWESDRDFIDPFFGCSTKLPRLMLRAAQLYRTSKIIDSTNTEAYKTLEDQVQTLVNDIMTTKLSRNSTTTLSLAVSCHDLLAEVNPILELHQQELLDRAVATAEIFRHAALIYAWRILEPPCTGTPPHIRDSVCSVFELLPLVPDCIGPGANLGWALVVIGAETDEEDQRQYIRCRYECLHALQMDNSRSAEKLLEAVWRHRDAVNTGCEPSYRPWQDIMHSINGDQILI